MRSDGEQVSEGSTGSPVPPATPAWGAVQPVAYLRRLLQLGPPCEQSSQSLTHSIRSHKELPHTQSHGPAGPHAHRTLPAWRGTWVPSGLVPLMVTKRCSLRDLMGQGCYSWCCSSDRHRRCLPWATAVVLSSTGTSETLHYFEICTLLADA